MKPATPRSRFLRLRTQEVRAKALLRGAVGEACLVYAARGVAVRRLRRCRF